MDKIIPLNNNPIQLIVESLKVELPEIKNVVAVVEYKDESMSVMSSSLDVKDAAYASLILQNSLNSHLDQCGDPAEIND